MQNENRKTVLITGASGGIGIALAKIFAEHNYNLILTGRNIERLQSLSEEIHAISDVVIDTVIQDLNGQEGAEALFATLNERQLLVDVLINNAGLGMAGPFAEISLEKNLNILNVNCVALTTLTHLLLKQMLKRNSGYIINIASMAAYQAGPFMAVYYASKAYVLSFSEALAEELKKTNVNVSVVCPGPVITEFFARANMFAGRIPSGKYLKIMTAEQIAKATFLGMKKNKRTVIPGALNYISIIFNKFTPRRITAKFAGFFNLK